MTQTVLQALHVPNQYQDLYSALDKQLSDFGETVRSKWDGSKHPTRYGPQLLMASASMYQSFLKPSYEAGVLTELQQIKATGANAVTINVNFPLMSRAFHTRNKTDFNAIADFYSRLAKFIRNQGMNLIVTTTVCTPLAGRDAGGLDTYLKTLSWDDYRAGRAENAVNVATIIGPDYLSLITEPDTEAGASGQSALNAATGAVQMVNQMLQAVRAAHVPNIKVGAGFGSWSMKDPSWLTSFLQTAIDYLDLHVYPVNKDFLLNLITAADAASAAGKQIGMSEAWAYKARDIELNKLTYSEGFARDVFSFWAPLDSKFLQALVEFSHFKKAAFLSPFWTHYFYAYLEFAKFASDSDADLIQASNIAAGKAYQTGVPTLTGRTWASLIGSTPDTSTPPDQTR